MKRLDDDLAKLARRYARFASVEARDSSPSYERLARQVAQSNELLEFIAALPPERQQPNLFLAALRATGELPHGNGALEEIIRLNGERVRQVMLTHATQTNEPSRCAVLLPALATLPQPLALLEVGASAGLCLLPDRYAYDYDGIRISPSGEGNAPAPVFPCTVNRHTPVPQRNIDVAWRAGLDLNPLDVHAAADMSWLRTLVWPEHHDRASRLNAAIEVARSDPPRVVKGDLRGDLPALAATAPKEATLVVYHTAVLGYLREQADRSNFAAMVRGLGAVWISNEAPFVFPELAKNAAAAPSPDMFLQAVDGVPVAWSGPHGQSLHWFG
ncbi:MAG: DUF2332 domain-containing protein [Alphaproteobacteria bacterium]|jgi:hypothetical protein|nr:DUF2332 domain-containing protein [Alphaproteobacteria bacterium]